MTQYRILPLCALIKKSFCVTDAKYGETVFKYKMEDLLDVAAFDFNLAEEAIINELLIPRENVRIRNMQYQRLDLNNLAPQECKAKFRFERKIGRLAAALNIPHRIETENRYVVSGKLSKLSKLEL